MNEDLLSALRKIKEKVESLDVNSGSGISQKEWLLGYLEGIIEYLESPELLK